MLAGARVGSSARSVSVGRIALVVITSIARRCLG